MISINTSAQSRYKGRFLNAWIKTPITSSSIMSHIVQCSVIIYNALEPNSFLTWHVLFIPSVNSSRSSVNTLSWPCLGAFRCFWVEAQLPTCFCCACVGSCNHSWSERCVSYAVYLVRAWLAYRNTPGGYRVTVTLRFTSATTVRMVNCASYQ